MNPTWRTWRAHVSMPAIVWLSLALALAVMLPVGALAEAFLTVALGMPFVVALMLAVPHMRQPCPFCTTATYKVNIRSTGKRVRWCQLFHVVFQGRRFRVFIAAEFVLVVIGTVATMRTGNRYYGACAVAVMFLSTAADAAAIHQHRRLARWCVWCTPDRTERN